MSKPKVSVIIPSYNHADFVEKAINSVLRQTISELEVIVVDDGSTDKTPDKVSAISDPRLTFIPLKENRRQHPRNLALSRAKGEYIAFQNSDDEWEPDKLEKQLGLMERNDDLSACFTRVKIIDERGRPVSGTWLNGLFDEKNLTRIEWLRRFFLKGNCLCISSSLVRGSALSKVGFFCPSLFYLSDFDLWVRMAGAGGLHTIEEHLTKMRLVKKGNLSSPSLPWHNTRVLEVARVLLRYTQPPIENDLHKIFEGSAGFNGSPAGNYLGLIKLAWETGSPAHMLFADRLLQRIIEDDKLYEEALTLYGGGLKNDFVKKRNALSISFDKKGGK